MQNDACSFQYYLIGIVWSHYLRRTEFRTGETLSINYKGRVSNTRMNSFLTILYILMRLLLSQIIFESSSMRRLNYFKDLIVPRKLLLQNIKIEIVKSLNTIKKKTYHRFNHCLIRRGITEQWAWRMSGDTRHLVGHNRIFTLIWHSHKRDKSSGRVRPGYFQRAEEG